MLTLADGRTRVDVTLTEPDGFSEGSGTLSLALADFGTLIAASPQLNKPDYRLSAEASDTVPDQPLDQTGNATTFGASNFTGTATVLRQTDSTGAPDPTTDTLFAAIGTKGVRSWWVERIGPRATVDLAVDDEGWIYEVISDDPQEPQDRAGYIKNVIPLGVQTRRRFVITA